MANIGLCRPYYAKYAESGGSVSYSGVAVLGKAIQADLSQDNADPQVLYADNGPAESVTMFNGASLTLGIDELSLEIAADVLGLTPPESNGGITFKAEANAPYVGIGLVVKKIKSGTVKWRAIVFYKAQFRVPDYSISTQGETVEFQTPELVAKIMRDDSTTPKWQFWQDFSSEADAVDAVMTALGYVAPTTTT